MIGPNEQQYSGPYKRGWLAAYERKPAGERGPQYTLGYAAGKKERERTDRNAPKLDAIVKEIRAKGVQRD